MWMKIKVWLYRRGLKRSPSASMVWERGTLFHPGSKINDLGGWEEWSKSLANQFLSRENPVWVEWLHFCGSDTNQVRRYDKRCPDCGATRPNKED